jgi:N6-adenosine-specific RNA methylase IME4
MSLPFCGQPQKVMSKPQSNWSRSFVLGIQTFYRMVAKRTPDQDRCDLFSRETRPGFDGWGREHGKFDLVA